MRGGKDWNNNTMEPLFPRLHVKDTEKGGPKPPPRNKMAVYEELITPSSRFTNGSTTILPLQPNGSGQIRHAGSSSQVGGPEKRTFSTFYGPPTSTHTTSRVAPLSQSNGILSNISANSAAKPLGYATSSVSGVSLMTARYSSFQRTNFIHFKRSSCDKDKVEVTFPSSAHQGESLDSGAKQHGLDQEKMNSPAMNLSIQSHETSSENRLKRASICDQDPEDHAKMSVASVHSREFQGSSKKMALVSTIRANVLTHGSSKLFFSNGVCESSKNVPKISSQHSSQPEQSKTPVEENNKDSANFLANSCVSLLATESCSGSSIGDKNGSPGNNSQCVEESENKSLQDGLVHRNEHASGTTEMDYTTSAVISPDDVVQKIGQKNFWKIRRILVNQQRIFSIQIFELHRLIRLQRSLTGSSNHFIEDSLCLHGRFHEVSNKDELLPPSLSPPLPQRTLPHAPVPPPPPPLPTHLQPNECLKIIEADKSLVKTPFPLFCDSARGSSVHGKTMASSVVMANKQGTSFNPPPSPPPLPPIESNDLFLKTAIAPENSFGKNLFPPLNSNQYSNSTCTSVSMDKCIKLCSYSLPTPPLPPPLIQLNDPLSKMLPSCFYPPPENQWLVTCMSSEGLVYKPYTGPCPPPPNAVFTPHHLYRSCGTPAGGGPYLLNAAYGIPASHQGKGVVPGIPITLPYLDPCGFSSTNPSPHEAFNHAVVEESSSCLPCSGRTVPGGSNDIDRQGSTGSSSVQDALPLFPLEPVSAAQELESAGPTLDSGSGEKQIQAIKAVPRDGRLATESALRIFQSIQEERRQNELDSVAKLQE